VRERGFCIEFLGLPASGKSTMSHAAAGTLRRYGLTVAEPTWTADHALTDTRRYLHKTRRIAEELLCRPGPAARALATVTRSRQRRAVGTLRATTNWLFIASLLERPPLGPAVQLLDEGLFQALWTVCFEAEVGDPGALIAALVRGVRCPDAVVVLEVGHAEVRQRLARRVGGMSRMDGAAGEAPENWWRSRRALAETRKLLNALADATGRPLVLPVRNDSPDDVHRLAECLAALVLSAEGGELRRAPLSDLVLG
jgi:hypothetical protein